MKLMHLDYQIVYHIILLKEVEISWSAVLASAMYFLILGRYLPQKVRVLIILDMYHVEKLSRLIIDMTISRDLLNLHPE